METTQLAFPSSKDFCTVAWAAELLGLSMRSVIRLVDEGRLHAYMPLVGSRESSRHKKMLSADEVREYKRALAVVRGPVVVEHLYGESSTGDRVLCSCGVPSPRIATKSGRKAWFRQHRG